MKRLILTLVLASPAANADIIFLDLNNAGEEIAAVERAAAARRPPERVRVIPTVDPARRRAQDAASRKADDAAAKLQKECPPNSTNPNCGRLREEWNRASEELRQATAANRLDGAKIKEELRKLEREGIKASSVVVSGHDGNGKFSGVYGAVTSDALNEAFSAAPNMTRDVKSVLLWGCYTTTLGSLDGHWRNVFPNVGIFAGFDGRGPNKYRPANHTYLEDFLKIDQALLNAGSQDEMKGMIRRIRGFSDTAASICIKDLIATPAGNGNVEIRNLSQLRRDCALDNETRSLLAEYRCYLEAREDRCKNPPIDVGASNPLRKLFGKLDSKPQCRAYWSSINAEVPELQNVQMLLFYNQVKLNLTSLHGADLAKIDKALRDVGAPAGLKVSDLDHLSRADMIKRLAAIETFLDRADFQVLDHPLAVEIDYLRGAVLELGEVMSSLQKTPNGWYDPSPTPSTFLQNAVAPERKDEIRVEHGVIRIDRRYSSVQEDLMRRHPDSARMKQLDADYNAALSSGNTARLDAVLQAMSDLETKMKRETAAQLAERVRQEMRSQRLSDLEKRSYELYLRRLTGS